jgi:hypothetical protein
MGVARLCRCNPWGSSGIDWVPQHLPQSARWYAPWRYGLWRGTHVPMRCEALIVAERDAERQ